MFKKIEQKLLCTQIIVVIRKIKTKEIRKEKNKENVLHLNKREMRKNKNDTIVLHFTKLVIHSSTMVDVFNKF